MSEYLRRDSQGRFHCDNGPAVAYNGNKLYLRHGVKHRLDGPAMSWGDGTEEYWVDGNIPTTILDLIIIPEEIDFETFPSATLVPEIKYQNCRQHHAYRISDPDELVLAILRYG